MLHTIENDQLICTIDSLGAEVRSLKNKSLNKEYICNQFITFIHHIVEFGLFNFNVDTSKNEYPEIKIRFANNYYCPKITINNSDFKAFKNNLAMYYFVMGYNDMFYNMTSRNEIAGVL